ncbi:MAG: hypothetical protein Q7R59_00805 [bacterium]|nr:hypothetical protein [bacterium]
MWRVPNGAKLSVMNRLTEQAEKLIDEFRKRINALPAEERGRVMREMTESISALNEEVKDAFAIFRAEDSNKGQKGEGNIDNISDFL